MQLVIKWAAGQSTEFLDFDLDNLDQKGVRTLRKTREWWSNRKIWACWEVKCDLEEIE